MRKTDFNRSFYQEMAGQTHPAANDHASRRSLALPTRRAVAERGIALVLVLALLALITVLIVGFFSRSINNRQISDNYSSEVKADALARGAVEQILGDFRSEIAAGSTTGTTQISGTNYLTYFPVSPWSAVPARTGTGNPTLPNLVKISRSGQPFYANPVGLTGTAYPNPPAVSGTGPSRAALAVSSTSASVNGRSIPVARWNAPLLLPRLFVSSTTDLTPIAAFTAPDWIYLDRSGTNPTAWNNNLRWSSTNPTAVVGRYAYAIYDTGGILDANVAGFPSGITAQDAASKGSLGLADLTQLPGMTQAMVDELVNWRNAATLGSSQPGSNIKEKYVDNYLSGTNSTGFLKVNIAGSSADRAFPSRQMLIDYFTNQMSSGSPADRINLLQYFSHWTRALNQPSLAPDWTQLPRVLTSSTNSSTDLGGNDAYPLKEPSINPKFPTILVTTSFPRADGSTANPGEPLVKTRFPLSRLGLITYNATAATGSLIYKYFGLTRSSASAPWVYDHGIKSGGIPVIGTLSQVAALSGANAREPDFFELLKAGMNVGSIAKGGWVYFDDGVARNYKQQYDTTVDYAIYQLGANIISQYDTSGYPTVIATQPTASINRTFPGIKNLPYFYRHRAALIQTRAPTPLPATATTVFTAAATKPPNFDGGQAVLLWLPELWNPHDQNSTSGSPGPSNFRVVVAYTTPRVESTSPASITVTADYGSNGTSAPALTGTFHQTLTNNTALNFTISGSGAFREPTLLNRPSLNGVSVSADVNSLFYTDTASSAESLPKLATPQIGGVLPDIDGSSYVGIYLGSMAQSTYLPLTSGTGIYYLSINNITSATYVPVQALLRTLNVYVQYQDAGANWITYDQKLVPGGDAWPMAARPGDTTPNQRVTSVFTSMAMDPRSNRFAVPCHNGGVSVTLSTGAPYLDANWGVFPTQRPDAGPQVTGVWSGKYYKATWGTPVQGLASKNGPQIGWYGDVVGSISLNTGLICQNNMGLPALTGSLAANSYFSDPDGVVRRGMAGNVPFSGGAWANTTVGLPMATATSYPAGTPTSQSQSRPVVLNRPFVSVAEMGYAFSGTPWRNIDFSDPESGGAGLLDLFTVSQDPAITAGRLNLNTMQPAVLQTVIAGVNTDTLNTNSAIAGGSNSLASQIAQLLVQRTSSVSGTNGPLSNVSELVGRWTGSTGAALPYSPNSYSGFSGDLTNLFGTTGSLPDAKMNNISRFREAPIRALADVSNQRVWNLMIDLIAQSGQFSPNAADPSQFIVQGEKHIWAHVAIDRITGQIVDQQIEVPTE